jgi:hypothetical protein
MKSCYLSKLQIIREIISLLMFLYITNPISNIFKKREKNENR